MVNIGGLGYRDEGVRDEVGRERGEEGDGWYPVAVDWPLGWLWVGRCERKGRRDVWCRR
jgi:hypothetical protein